MERSSRLRTTRLVVVGPDGDAYISDDHSGLVARLHYDGLH